jgi:type IV pilus assembly protein PilA
MLARIRKSMEEKDQGFTLIELLVVIIIIGILAAIAIPVFLNQRKKGWDSQAKSDARNLATLEETYLTDNNTYVAAADKATAVSVLPDYKPSANVNEVEITTVAADSFCVSVESDSGNWFTYKSDLGGLQAGSTAASGC